MMKRLKRPTVQLTSLLDLLFVMIFVSLIQSKEVPKQAEPEPAPPAPKVTKPEVVVKPEVKPEVKPRPVQYSVTATFHFYGPKSNPGLPEGKYAMQGRYNRKTGALQLGGLGWLERPEGYDMVPLSGEIKDGSDIFRGRIEFQQCETFTLQRIEKTGETPISGAWKGLYTCSQGETGLTLTIE